MSSRRVFGRAASWADKDDDRVSGWLLKTSRNRRRGLRRFFGLRSWKRRWFELGFAVPEGAEAEPTAAKSWQLQYYGAEAGGSPEENLSRRLGSIEISGARIESEASGSIVNITVTCGAGMGAGTGGASAGEVISLRCQDVDEGMEWVDSLREAAEGLLSADVRGKTKAQTGEAKAATAGAASEGGGGDGDGGGDGGGGGGGGAGALPTAAPTGGDGDDTGVTMAEVEMRVARGVVEASRGDARLAAAAADATAVATAAAAAAAAADGEGGGGAAASAATAAAPPRPPPPASRHAFTAKATAAAQAEAALSEYSFSLDRACLMVRMCEVAYADPGVGSKDGGRYVRNCADAGVNAPGYWFSHKASGAQLHILNTPDAIILAFRGLESDSWDDIAANFRSWFRPWHECPGIAGGHRGRRRGVALAPGVGGSVEVHSGYLNAWMGLRSAVVRTVRRLLEQRQRFAEACRAARRGGGGAQQQQQQLSADEQMMARPRLLITGHSMGGALAMLAALELRNAQRRGAMPKAHMGPVHLYTFGCPSIGDARFAAHFERPEHLPSRQRGEDYGGFCVRAARAGAVHYRVVNDHDISPNWLWRAFGGRHTGTQIWMSSAVSGVSGVSGGGGVLIQPRVRAKDPRRKVAAEAQRSLLDRRIFSKKVLEDHQMHRYVPIVVGHFLREVLEHAASFKEGDAMFRSRGGAGRASSVMVAVAMMGIAERGVRAYEPLAPGDEASGVDAAGLGYADKVTRSLGAVVGPIVRECVERRFAGSEAKLRLAMAAELDARTEADRSGSNTTPAGLCVSAEEIEAVIGSFHTEQMDIEFVAPVGNLELHKRSILSSSFGDRPKLETF